MFVPSVYSYGDEAAAPAAAPAKTDWLSKITGALTGGGGSSGLDAWASVVNALADPRERVAVLKAKIANYQKMKKTVGIGPIGLLYDNQIALMRARLSAETESLRQEKAGEASTATWRDQGHLLAYVGIGVLALGGTWIAVRTIRTAQAPQ